MDFEDRKGAVRGMNTLELTDAEVQYLFCLVMAEYGSTAENATVAKKLTEILKERRKG